MFNETFSQTSLAVALYSRIKYFNEFISHCFIWGKLSKNILYIFPQKNPTHFHLHLCICINYIANIYILYAIKHIKQNVSAHDVHIFRKNLLIGNRLLKHFKDLKTCWWNLMMYLWFDRGKKKFLKLYAWVFNENLTRPLSNHSML